MKKPSNENQENKLEEESVLEDLGLGDMGKFKVGLRTIKTAVAVFFCLLVGFLVAPEMGLYSCFAAVVCMRETVDQSWHVGLHRFLGTLIGGALGYALVTIALRTPNYEKGLYLIIIPLGLIICIWLCTLIGKKDGVVICCVVFIGIGLEPELDKFATLYNVGLRVVDTTVGIVVAGLVNKFIFPYVDGESDCAVKKQEKNG